jgi:hypothetical protein
MPQGSHSIRKNHNGMALRLAQGPRPCGQRLGAVAAPVACGVRIPTKSAGDSGLMSATHSD